MAVRSAELGRIAWVAAGAQTVFTVPSGETWLLKDLRWSYGAAVAITFYWFHSRGGGPALFHVSTLPAGPAASGFNPWVVFEPGDSLQVTPSITPVGLAIALASGSMLLGVA